MPFSSIFSLQQMDENKNNIIKSRICGREWSSLVRVTGMKKSKCSCITYINTWDYEGYFLDSI